MGRKPISKRAMSGAERIRRWRQRHASEKPPAKRALIDEMARLKAENERLTVENEQLRARARRRRSSISSKACALTSGVDVLTKQKQGD